MAARDGPSPARRPAVLAAALSAVEALFPNPNAKVLAVYAGGSSAFALLTNGSVVILTETPGVVGDVPEAARSGVVAVVASDRYALALKYTTLSVIAWGCRGTSTMVLPSGATQEFQCSELTTTVPEVLASSTMSIAAGQYHALAIRKDRPEVWVGGCFAWG